MEYSKEQIMSLKATIKSLSEQQKSLRLQRKTVHFTGTRTVPAWLATQHHHINRYELRHLYIAYAIMRGKPIEAAEVAKPDNPYNADKVQKILTKYGEVVHTNP
jgi:hypothetical protein